MDYLRNKLILWYRKHGRDFPWRHNIDPYRIMIAELMLHRTRAEQVMNVYREFIQKYPDTRSLAKADINDVKKYIGKLGLHWRTRHFIDSAKYINEKHNGIFPDNYESLKKIPGAGDYIAAAILITAFNKPAPAVDSNIARFLKRFYGLKVNGEIRRKKEVIEKSKELFSFSNSRELLFALVDFTALVCKPRKPKCNQCPLKDRCSYYKNINNKIKDVM